MSVKPILFNNEMVRAILDGRKTVTRRVVSPQPVSKLAFCIAGYNCGTWGYPCDDVWKYWGDAYKRDTPIPEDERSRHWTPPCRTDDLLWVRETWSYGCTFVTENQLFYKADGDSDNVFRWRPSIHMPKEAARIWLRVTDVRVERLQAINECEKEGIKNPCTECKATFGCDNCVNDGYQEIDEFSKLWDSTIKPADIDRYGWDANPWVWVIEFERCEMPEEV